MLAPDAKHMHVDATDGKTYRMALVRPLERQFGQEKPVKVNIMQITGRRQSKLSCGCTSKLQCGRDDIYDKHKNNSKLDHDHLPIIIQL